MELKTEPELLQWVWNKATAASNDFYFILHSFYLSCGVLIVHVLGFYIVAVRFGAIVVVVVAATVVVAFAVVVICLLNAICFVRWHKQTNEYIRFNHIIYWNENVQFEARTATNQTNDMVQQANERTNEWTKKKKLNNRYNNKTVHNFCADFYQRKEQRKREKKATIYLVFV